ncbi:g722 [Coccomyxa viridis]|uniref:G722 protein n=1 Tax=Coccomyxa viridis TaxID=1274662 RepID=A0ABP1FLM8_9CHLO
MLVTRSWLSAPVLGGLGWPSSGSLDPEQAFTSINSPETGETLDRGIALRFPGPASFTGENVVELHTHGGPAVVRAVLEALQNQPGVRLAEPGEFTQRAFQAGKLDLTEVEGLADLLAAETEAQRIQALQQSTGALRKAMATWRSTLLRCLASSEAIIDFGEDEEISADVSLDVLKMAQQLRRHLQKHVTSSRRGELIRTGVKVAIVGRPNAGKSSLLNALAARDAAIVSSTPGTTRDTVEVAVDLAGQKVTLVDTAGLRESADEVERMGMERARSAMTSADIIAVVLDLQSEPELATTLQQQEQQRDSAGAHQQGLGAPDILMLLGKRLIEEVVGPGGVGSLHSEAAGEQNREPESSGGTSALEQQESDSAVSRPQHQRMLLVLNKSDLSPLSQQLQASSAPIDGGSGPDSSPMMSNGTFPTKTGTESSLRSSEEASGDMAGAVAISCRTGDGLDRLLAKLSQVVADITQSGDADGAIFTRLRHRQLIEECVEALLRFESIWEQPELAAEELRAAAHALGKVTGAIDTEDILDALFGEFCIGK